MNLRQFYTGRAIGFLVVLSIVGIVAGFFSLNNYIYQQKQGDGNDFEPYRGTLTGESVCLPHTNTDGPQTLECALGLKTDVGEYFALDLALMSQQHRPINTGERLSANGLITPVERLSSDHWQKYPIEGIFSVTDSLEIQE